MASSIKKIKEVFGDILSANQCASLYVAMRAIDGHKQETGLKKRDGWDLAEEILNSTGTEYIPNGQNDRSPWIQYVCMDDIYDMTVIERGDRVSCYIGSVGAILEFGIYE